LKKNKRKSQKEAKNGQKASWPQGASLAASHARGQQVLAARLLLAASWQPPCGAGRKLAALLAASSPRPCWPRARGVAGHELPAAMLAASSRPCWPQARGGLAGRCLAACCRKASRPASWPLPCGLLPQGHAASKLAGRCLAASSQQACGQRPAARPLGLQALAAGPAAASRPPRDGFGISGFRIFYLFIYFGPFSRGHMSTPGTLENHTL